MNQEKLKNIIILKDLPSNLVEEAIIILKDNNQSNKNKMEEYAKEEAKGIVTQYLKDIKKNKKRSKKKIKLFTFLIITISILILVIANIH